MTLLILSLILYQSPDGSLYYVTELTDMSILSSNSYGTLVHPT